MNYEIVQVLNQLTHEKKLTKEFLLDTLEAGILSAAKKRFGEEADIDVHIELGSGIIQVIRNRKVIEEIENPDIEIELEDAQEIDPDVKLGETLHEDIPFDEFGRNAVQAAKQILMQRVREAERENIYSEYLYCWRVFLQ